MTDYTNPALRQRILNAWQKTKQKHIPIVVVTYNRLIYLRSCIASIQAGTTAPYKLLVVDDDSDDGTKEYLHDLKSRDKIHDWFNTCGMGTAQNFNQGIEYFDDPWVVIANDDMFFHRWWDFACMDILLKVKNVATLAFFDHHRKDILKEPFDGYDHVIESGLGASFINREAWRKVDKFYIRRGARMGWFAGMFCRRITDLEQPDKYAHYATNPNWASHMDIPTSPMCERDVLQEYVEHRAKTKLH